MLDPDWPDKLNIANGLLVYYGDNKRPGHKLHDTPKKGNRLLRFCFQEIHNTPPHRERLPPFFIFTKGPMGRDVIFRGLAACGSPMINPIDDLIAVWKSSKGTRFQNYKANFTILSEPIISRAWIKDLHAGNPLSENCPKTWLRWVETGEYEALQAKSTLSHRVKKEQLPSTERDWQIINNIYGYFKDNPFGFEHCAAKIASLMDKNIISYDVTRPWRDGGRDAIGTYRIGTESDNIEVEFAIEAKCYKPGVGVGVAHTSRLISRLKHRQFGILVTTSYVGEQPYKEIREDGHPVIIISADDITKILIDSGINSAKKVLD